MKEKASNNDTNDNAAGRRVKKRDKGAGDKKEGGTDVIRALWEKETPAERTALFSTLLIGILTHLFMITNKLPNWDDVYVIPTTGLGPYAGRWLGDPSAHWFSQWSAPGINGVMAVVFLAITAALVVNLFGIRSITGAVLTGAALVTFPSIASNMTFMYASPTYSLSILMMTLSVWLTRKVRFGWIFGIVLEMLAMGIYQAYFPWAVCLFLFCLILDLADGRDKKVSTTAKRGLSSLFVLVCGMALYLFSVKLSGYALADYKGMADIGQESPSVYLRACARAYHRVLEYFVTNPASYGGGALHVLHMLMMALLFILIILVFIDRKVWKSWGAFISWWFLLLLMPLAMGLVYVMSVETDHASTIMIFAFCMPYLMIPALAERVNPGAGLSVRLAKVSAAGLEEGVDLDSYNERDSEEGIAEETSSREEDRESNKENRGNREDKDDTKTDKTGSKEKKISKDIAKGISAGASKSSTSSGRAGRKVLVIFSLAVLFAAEYCNYQNINKAYYRMYLANQRVYSFCTRVVAKLEEQEGYSYDQPFMILGDYDEKWLSLRDTDGALMDDWEGMSRENGLLTEAVRPQYIRLYLGIDSAVYEGDTAASIKSKEAYLKMPVYPAKGSIEKIDGIWVVKLSD